MRRLEWWEQDDPAVTYRTPWCACNGTPEFTVGKEPGQVCPTCEQVIQHACYMCQEHVSSTPSGLCVTCHMVAPPVSAFIKYDDNSKCFMYKASKGDVLFLYTPHSFQRDQYHLPYIALRFAEFRTCQLEAVVAQQAADLAELRTMVRDLVASIELVPDGPKAAEVVERLQATFGK